MRSRPSRPSVSFAAGIALVALTTTVAGSSACAQIFTGGVTNPTVAMPTEPVAPAPVISPSALAPASKTLRFLPNTLEGLRITGETGDLTWPVYLSAGQARAVSHFRLGYLSAVSVLPDSSFIEIRINDRKIGADVIDSASGLRTVEFSVPADLLQRGYNAIALTVQERHRVDCSVAATYELWTKIDPSETGLVLGSEAIAIADVADLPALLPRSDGTLPIHVLLSGKTNPAHLQRLIKATQEIALAAHALQPSVDFDPATGGVYGVTLALGTRAALGQIAFLKDQLGAAGPLAKVLPAPVAGRPTLVVTGSTEAEVDAATDDLGRVELRGSAAGRDAITRYPALASVGGTTLRLKDLGIKSQDFDGRFFRKSFNLRLPADFLASDYGRGTIDLAGGYAAGLVRGSQVRVDVNGRSAGVIKLPYAAGDVFKHNQLFLLLSQLRPGLNRVDIIAETPRPEDSVCAASGRRFLLLDRSEVTLPVLAHVERLPDLGLMTAGALPYFRGTSHLVVPKPDRDSMAAALSLTARAAVTAGRLVPFRFSTTAGDSDDGSTLIVAPARQLDPSSMTSVGLDPAKVEAAWRGIAAGPTQPGAARWWMTNTDGPSACRLPAPANAPPTIAETPPSGSPIAVSTGSAGSDDLLTAWTGSDAGAPGWREHVWRLANHAIGWAEGLAQAIYVPAMARSRADGLTSDASLILAQGMSPGSSENVTTIVTAPNAAMLRASMACLFDPQVWSKVQGRLAMVNAVNGEVMTIPTASFHYVASGESSLGNSRLVWAGWFSLNPLAFAGVALATALCLSGTTLWFVRNVGRRPE